MTEIFTRLVITFEGKLTLGELTDELLKIDHNEWPPDSWIRFDVNEALESIVMTIYPGRNETEAL